MFNNNMQQEIVWERENTHVREGMQDTFLPQITHNLDSPPHPATVTTRFITFSIGDGYRSNTDVTWCWSPKNVGDNFRKFSIISGHFEMEAFHLTVMCCCLFVEEQSSKDKNRVATWYLILWLICVLVCESMGIYVDPVWQFVSVFFSAPLHFGLHHVDLRSLLWLKIVEAPKENQKKPDLVEIPTSMISISGSNK